MSIYELLENYNYPLKSGLTYKNEFTFLIAIILSAQAKDEFVNSQTINFFDNYDTPEKILNLGEGLFQFIKSIGLWRNKGRNILKLSHEIIELKKIKNLKEWYQNSFSQYDENDMVLYSDTYLSDESIPTFRAGLLNFSGIGRKSANAFLNTIYQAPVIAVDTHVKRLSNRLGLVDTLDPLKIELSLNLIVPAEYQNKISHYLVWHGRRICKAINPKCQQCTLRNYCFYYSEKIY